jgi:hypothetical protein
MCGSKRVWREVNERAGTAFHSRLSSVDLIGLRVLYRLKVADKFRPG